jgi:hypothetical protein
MNNGTFCVVSAPGICPAILTGWKWSRIKIMPLRNVAQKVICAISTYFFQSFLDEESGIIHLESDAWPHSTGMPPRTATSSYLYGRQEPSAAFGDQISDRERHLQLFRQQQRQFQRSLQSARAWQDVERPETIETPAESGARPPGNLAKGTNSSERRGGELKSRHRFQSSSLHTEVSFISFRKWILAPFNNYRTGTGITWQII